MKKLVIGILAHVDAGKTTLSESMLYISGSIRKIGRVDHGDAFLDTYALERERGITIFSKQAMFEYGETKVTLLDTPGHVDFSAEMERTLQVLDYAILVISGADGIQGHTKTLWRLLSKYRIPVFLFVNKMDQKGTNKEDLLTELRENLHENCVDFSEGQTTEFYEQIAMCDEHLLDHFLETESIPLDQVKRVILERKIFPCYFGSALRLEGMEEFLQGLNTYTCNPIYPNEFGAKVFKIVRDEQGNRLTYMKITGGSLKVKDVLTDHQEKVNQIRIYSGVKYDTINEMEAGNICAVTGLTKTFPGQGLGMEEASGLPILSPVLTYKVLLPSGCDAAVMLPKLLLLEEEVPELHIVWEEQTKSIQVQIMGEVQTEVLKTLIKERFDVDVTFGSGSIVYKETIDDVVEGVGHFEPLRHYAEVHLLLAPLPRGSGLQFTADCSEDLLGRNWQRLILTHLEEKEHKGVLTGSTITDMKITLIAGRAHQKHTEGGDFREATYRAVRQGLKEATSILLEPYYEFRLEVPEQSLGRAITDMDRMFATFEIQQNENGMAVLTGSGPVVTMQNYSKEVIAYTKGLGKLFCSLKGYEKCHNSEEVIERIGYDSERDLNNPTGSVFCAHGAGFIVNWDQVKQYMHVESPLTVQKGDVEVTKKESSNSMDEWIDTDEIDAILEKTFYSNRSNKSKYSKGSKRKLWEVSSPTIIRPHKQEKPQEEYLLVDGYNVIYANPELKELATDNMDAASGKLMDILCNYQGIRGCHVILVFDAYKIVGHQTEILNYHNIHVVYTKEAETADQYIEKFAHENSHKYRITVATSDGVEQIIIMGKGCSLLSAREFWKEIERLNKKNREEYLEKQTKNGNYLFDSLSDEITNQIKNLHNEDH